MTPSRRVLVVGKAISAIRGRAVAHVSVEVVPGLVVRARMTARAFDELGVKVGEDTCLVVAVGETLGREQGVRARVDSPQGVRRKERTPCFA